MRQPPEPRGARYFVRAILHHYNAGRWSIIGLIQIPVTDIRSPIFVQRQIPHGDRPRPVSENTVGPLRPIGPARQWVVARSAAQLRIPPRSTLGKVRALLWKRIMRLRHSRDLARIAVPGY